jgi:histidinol phosphatase-like PHP family hydrolase
MAQQTGGRTLLLQAGRCDFHIHTNVSPDGAKNCTLSNIIAVAEGFGMREIGLTDHVMAMSGTDTAPHKALCDAIHAVQSRVKAYAGWEVDYFDGGKYSFDPERHLSYLDYVLLAHHDMRHMLGESPEANAKYLLRITMEMAREPYAHIIAHPFYYPPSAERNAPSERHAAILSRISDAQYAEVFHAIRENGKAAEITSYQFNADLRAVDEMKRMYAAALSTGVKFTLDSDAHSLWDMAEGLRCSYVLAELGFTDDDFVDYRGFMALKERS